MQGEKPRESAQNERSLRRMRTPGKELVSARLEFGGKLVQLEVRNYHHKGACLKLTESAISLLSLVETSDLHIEFQLGQVPLGERQRFRIAWIDNSSELMGIELLPDLKNAMTRRPPRYKLARHITCGVVVDDPTQPTRQIYLKVEDLSTTGMCLSTSLSNAHLLPGMSLRGGVVQIPGRGEHVVDFYIENTRPAKDLQNILVGVSFTSIQPDCRKALGSFLVALEKEVMDPDFIKDLKMNDLLGKSVRSDLTFRFVETLEEYEEVVALRNLAYSKAGKVASGSVAFAASEEAFKGEGKVIAAYLGQRLVATAEIRISTEDGTLRSFAYPEVERLVTSVSKNAIFEVNRFAIHPDMQGSDVVLGSLQAIHSIVASRGAFDCCILSSDDLVPLYERVGMKALPFKTKHPVRKDTTLTLMWMPAEAYLKATSVNPVVWERVYAKNHLFQAGLNVVEDFKRTPAYHAKKYVGAVSFVVKDYFLKRKRDKLKQELRRLEEGQKPQRKDSGDDLFHKESHQENSHLTKPHFHISIINCYLRECDARHGPSVTDSILTEIGLTRAYFSDYENWVSVEFLDCFLDAYSRHGDIRTLTVSAARRSVSKEELGFKWYALKLMTPEQPFLQTEKLLTKFNRTRTVRIVSIRPGFVKLEIGLKSPALRPKHDSSCDHFKEAFASYIFVTTGKKAKVKQTSSIYEGKNADTYEVSWSPSSQILRKCVSFTLVQSLGALIGYLVSGLAFQDEQIAVSMLIGVLSSNLLFLLYLNLKNIESNEKFTNLIAETEESAHGKYLELQSAKESLSERFREAQLLEQISHRIQSLQGVNEVVSFALKSICTDFSFDRAFVMLVNQEDSKTLETFAVEGVGENLRELWNFRVDVSVRKENPQLISSVFHSGEPVIIDNVENHFFQFNEASRKLIRQLGTHGFIIVAIRSDKDTWGVIVSDKVPNGNQRRLLKNDVRLLQRVAQTLALALDQEKRVEEQRTLRSLFERYVPSDVISSSLANKNKEVLGGIQRNITAMFFDIRDFTSKTQSMSPQSVVNMVNRIFSAVEEEVRKSGGRIDKFLGDGALAVWGSLSDTRDGDASLALSAALALVQRWPDVNASLLKSGLPEVQFGIGLHTGPALVGHVGGEARCEFTCMGSTINLASRIEGTCKEHGAVVAVSQECFVLAVCSKDSVEWRSDFVRIKGLKELCLIHFLRAGEVKKNEAKEER